MKKQRISTIQILKQLLFSTENSIFTQKGRNALNNFTKLVLLEILDILQTSKRIYYLWVAFMFIFYLTMAFTFVFVIKWWVLA